MEDGKIYPSIPVEVLEGDVSAPRARSVPTETRGRLALGLSAFALAAVEPLDLDHDQRWLTIPAVDSSKGPGETCAICA